MLNTFLLIIIIILVIYYLLQNTNKISNIQVYKEIKIEEPSSYLLPVKHFYNSVFYDYPSYYVYPDIFYDPFYYRSNTSTNAYINHNRPHKPHNRPPKESQPKINTKPIKDDPKKRLLKK